jgi:DNA topoisomerase-1
VKQGKLNASLPEGTTADTISLEQAVELLAAKAASGKTASGKTATGKPKGRKPAAKKPAAATPAAKKAPTTTKTGRLRASAVRVIKAADR